MSHWGSTFGQALAALVPSRGAFQARRRALAMRGEVVQAVVLARLELESGETVAGLAGVLGVRERTVEAGCRALARRGLVEFEPGSGWVTLTEAGRAVLAGTRPL